MFALAKEYIAKGWHSGCQFAVNAQGASVCPTSSEAVAWDLEGAVYAASRKLCLSDAEGDWSPGSALDLSHGARETMRAHLQRRGKVGPTQGPVTWNMRPGRTVEDVLNLLDDLVAGK